MILYIFYILVFFKMDIPQLANARQGHLDYVAELKRGLPIEYHKIFNLEWMLSFGNTFAGVRNQVESSLPKTHASARKVLSLTLGAMFGRKTASPQEVYSVLMGLLGEGWKLGTSAGVFPDILTLDSVFKSYTPEERITIAHVYNIILTWGPTLIRLLNQKSQLIFEAGSGVGDSAMLLAYLLPDAEITSITVSPEQQMIASRINEEMGFANRVHIELVDALNLNELRRLSGFGRFDEAGAKEMIGHIPWGKQPEFYYNINQLLRPNNDNLPNAHFMITDTPLPNNKNSIHDIAAWFYEKQIQWHLQTENQFMEKLLPYFNPTSWVDDKGDEVDRTTQFFIDTRTVTQGPEIQRILRQEYGYNVVFVRAWVEIMRLFKLAADLTRYVHMDLEKK